MDEKLVVKVARAVAEDRKRRQDDLFGEGAGIGFDGCTELQKEELLADATAAIQAIRDAGAYVEVPVMER